MADTKIKTATNKTVTKPKKASAIHFKGGQGKMYVKSTFNTTYVTFTDGNGRVARAVATLILFLDGYDIRKFFSFEEYFDDP